MKSIKCPQCGLTNWETADWCKRCKLILKSTNITSPNPTVNSSATFNQSQTNTQQNTYSQPAQPRPSAYRNTGTSYKAVFDRENGFIAKNIERCNRNLMIVCIVTILAVLGGFFLNIKYLSNVILGPATIAQDKLLFSKNVPDSFRNYAKIVAEDVYDSGATMVEISKYNVETVQSKYLILQIQDKFLLAEVDPDSGIIDGATNVSMNGEIADIPSAVSEKVLEPILKKQPEMRTSFLPFILKAKSGYSFSAYIGSGIGFIVLLIAGFCLWSVLKKIGNPENSSIIKSLAIYGSPLEIAASIDNEIIGQHEKIGAIYLLPSWIVTNNTFSLSIQHIEDVAWMYKKVTKHSVNLIPTGKTYEVVLHNLQGTTTSLNGSFLNDKKTDQILEKIYQRVPWVITGYDDELIAYWNKDKPGFVQTVKSRKKSYADSLSKPEACAV